MHLEICPIYFDQLHGTRKAWEFSVAGINSFLEIVKQKYLSQILPSLL